MISIHHQYTVLKISSNIKLLTFWESHMLADHNVRSSSFNEAASKCNICF